MSSTDRPLLTFAIAALNQEPYIREAVEAAFAQTYSPLEIVLSDDGSEDRTFAMMREMAAAYRGPHRLILNQNPVRRSIGGHINRIVELSTGELIVGAAGDDISLPQRTQVAYEAWERSGRKATSIHSSIIQIDEHGRKIDEIFKSRVAGESNATIDQQVKPVDYVRTLDPIVFGCAHTFSRQLFRLFGNLPDHIIHEDNALAFRSILKGRLLAINEPTVRYRLHGNNVFISSRKRATDLKSLERQEDRFRRALQSRESMYEGFLIDLDKARQENWIGEADYKATAEEAIRIRRRYALQREFLESGIISKCRILLRLKKAGLEPDQLRGLTRRLVPRPLLLRIQLIRGYATARSSST